jgi:hypothetical protein
MESRLLLVLSISISLMVLLTGQVLADQITRCPHCMSICDVQGCGLSGPSPDCYSECPPDDLCDSDDVSVSYCRNLESNWDIQRLYNAMSIPSGKKIEIQAAEVITELRATSGSVTADLEVFDCLSNNFIKISDITVGNNRWNRTTHDVTSYFTSCPQQFKFRISPDLTYGRSLRVRSTDLRITYKITDPTGALGVTIGSTLGTDRVIEKNHEFTVSSSVSCSGGLCGNVHIAVQQGGTDPSIDHFYNIQSDPYSAFFTYDQNPHYCGYMIDNTPCGLKKWEVTPTTIGQYLIRTYASSDMPGVSPAESIHIPVDVVPQP